MPPAPSHWFFWQSPGVCPAVNTPTFTNCVPHAWFVHVATLHSLPVAGQSVGALHATQPSAELQTLVLAVVAQSVATPATQSCELHVLAAVYTLPTQPAAELQSLAEPQPRPAAQVLPRPSQTVPPQSTPVSLPSLTPSLQDTHVPGPEPKQMPWLQSLLTRQ